MKYLITVILVTLLSESFCLEENLEETNNKEILSRNVENVNAEIEEKQNIINSPLLADVNDSELPENPFGVKEKRCPAFRLGSSLNQNPDSSDTKKGKKLYETFCEICVSRHKCTDIKDCPLCEKWCSATSDLCNETDAENSPKGATSDDKQTISEVVSLGNRGSFPDEDKTAEPNFSTITLNGGDVMEIILYLLGVRDTREVKQVEIRVQSKGDKPVVLIDFADGVNGVANDKLAEKVKELKEYMNEKLNMRNGDGLDQEYLHKLVSDVLDKIKFGEQLASDSQNGAIVGIPNDADMEIVSRINDPVEAAKIIHESLMNPDIIEDTPEVPNIEDQKLRENPDPADDLADISENKGDPSGFNSPAAKKSSGPTLSKSPEFDDLEEAAEENTETGAVSADKPVLTKINSPNDRSQSRTNQDTDRLQSEQNQSPEFTNRQKTINGPNGYYEPMGYPSNRARSEYYSPLVPSSYRPNDPSMMQHNDLGHNQHLVNSRLGSQQFQHPFLSSRDVLPIDRSHFVPNIPNLEPRGLSHSPNFHEPSYHPRTSQYPQYSSHFVPQYPANPHMAPYFPNERTANYLPSNNFVSSPYSSPYNSRPLEGYYQNTFVPHPTSGIPQHNVARSNIPEDGMQSGSENRYIPETNQLGSKQSGNLDDAEEMIGFKSPHHHHHHHHHLHKFPLFRNSEIEDTPSVGMQKVPETLNLEDDTGHVDIVNRNEPSAITPERDDKILGKSEGNTKENPIEAMTSEVFKRLKEKQNDAIQRLSSRYQKLENSRQNLDGKMMNKDSNPFIQDQRPILGSAKNTVNPQEDLSNTRTSETFGDINKPDQDQIHEDILGSQPLESSWEIIQPDISSRHSWNTQKSSNFKDPLLGDAINTDPDNQLSEKSPNDVPDVNSRGQFENQALEPNALGSIIPADKEVDISFKKPSDVYFIGNCIKLPLQMVQKSDGAVHFSVDLNKLCSCNNTSCPNNHTVQELEQTVGTILEKEAELKDQLKGFEDLKNNLGSNTATKERRYSAFSDLKSRIVNHPDSMDREDRRFRRSINKHKKIDDYENVPNGEFRKNYGKTADDFQNGLEVSQKKEHNTIPVINKYKFRGLEDQLAKNIGNIEKTVDKYSELDDKMLENESIVLSKFNEDPIIRQELGLVTNVLGFLKKLAIDTSQNKN